MTTALGDGAAGQDGLYLSAYLKHLRELWQRDPRRSWAWSSWPAAGVS